MPKIQQYFKKCLIWLMILSLTISYIYGGIVPFSIPGTKATANITISTQGLLNGSMVNYPIASSSSATPVMRIQIANDTSGNQLGTTTISFDTTNFNMSDLDALQLATSSGVSLYSSADYYFDNSDNVIVLNDYPEATSTASSTIVTFHGYNFISPQNLIVGTSTFFVVIRTRPGAADGHIIAATMPANGIEAAYGEYGPDTAFVANSYKIDNTGPGITKAELMNNNSVKIIFNEKISDADIGNLNNYTFNNGLTTTNAYRYSDNTIAVQANSAIPSGATITTGGNIRDLAGNANASTTAVYIQSPAAKILISEFSPSYGSEGFIELYNASSTSIDMGNWTIEYSYPTTVNWQTIGTIPSATFIDPYGFYLLAPAAFTALTPDSNLTSRPYGGFGGHIRIKNNYGQVVDKLGWGEAVEPEGTAAASFTMGTYSLERKASGVSTAATMITAAQDRNKGNSWDTQNNYNDFVEQNAPEPQNTSSSAEYLVISASDLMIEHAPVTFAATSSDMTIYAKISQTGTDPNEINAEMKYMWGDGTKYNNLPADYASSSPGFHQANGVFKFTVPMTDLNAPASITNGLYYYLKASVGSNIRYFSNSPTADTNGNENQVAVYAITTICGSVVNTYTVSGNVQLSGQSDHSGILVIADGTSNATTTDSSGNYSLTMWKPGSYNFHFVKAGYYLDSIFGQNAYSSSVTAPAKTLYPGTSGGSSGDITSPKIKWSGPVDGNTNMPINDPYWKIKISFSKDINPATISTDNIKLTTDGINNIAGYATSSLVYDPIDRTYLPTEATDPYLLVINPPTLVNGTTYHLTLTSNVRDWAGNALQGNLSGGGHHISFSTMPSGTYTYGSGYLVPPHVQGIKPSPGSTGAALNTKIAIGFSDSLDINSVNATNIKLDKITPSGYTESATDISITPSLDAGGNIVIIDPDPLALDSNTKYKVTLKGGLKSAAGVMMGALSTDNVYTSYFETGSATDATAPLLTGSWPADGATGISTNPGTISIQFNEILDPSAVNANTASLKLGSTIVSSEVKYDPSALAIYIMPKVSLNSNTAYSIYLTGSSSGIKDLSGNHFSATNRILTFTTSSSYDTDPPNIMYANADEYKIAITFNEPMSAAGINDTQNWPYSVLNPENYRISTGSPATVCGAGTLLNTLPSAQFAYDSFTNTVMISNYGIGTSSIALSLCINMEISTSSDLSGNRISDSTALKKLEAIIQDSADTNGILGPSTGGTANYDMGTMGMMRAGAFPMNQMAGQTTKYMIDIPITTSVSGMGGMIAITFPIGFDVSGAMKDPYSPMNNDINGSNAGVVTLSTAAESSGGANNDGITVEPASRLIKITLDGDSTLANDYLHLDIAGIVNTTVPRSYDTSGYTVDIKTWDGNYYTMESIVSMPFFITPSGSNELTINLSGILAADVDGNGDYVKVYLSSPLTGPIDKQITIDTNGNASGNNIFTGLPNGQYYIFTDPYISLDGHDYTASSTGDPIYLTASTSKTLNLTKETAGAGKAAVAVNITGTFGTDDIDVWASGPNSSKFKTFYDVGNGTTTTFYLTDGIWMIGMGPAIPAGSMSGNIKMPDWMPPMSVQVTVSGNGTVVTESSGTADNDTVEFNIDAASKQIIGYVKDGSNNAIADADVWAYQPGGAGGAGANTRTDTDGKFILKVSQNGTYKVGAYKSGLPTVPDRGITVKADSAYDDGNSTADIFNETGATTTLASPFVIKIKRPSYTIYGKVTDGTNPVAYAPVWANQSNGYGNSNTTSDSAGNYILYVDNGAWLVNAYISGYGNAETKTVVVNGADVSQNLNPNSSSYYSISGIVGIDTNANFDNVETAFSYMPIRAVAYSEQGIYLGKEYHGTTDSNGAYKINVPAGIYRVDIWTNNYGELGINDHDNDNTLNEIGADQDDYYATNPANINAQSGDVNNANIIIVQSAMRDIAVVIANAPAGQEAYLRIEGVTDATPPIPTGFKNYIRINDASATTTLRLAAGDYLFFLDVPGRGNFKPDSSSLDAVKKVIVVSNNRTVNFTLPASDNLINVTGNVTDGYNYLSGAWVWVNNPSTGYNYGTQTTASGTYTLNIPSGTNYNIGSDKPGYLSSATTSISIATTTALNFTLTPANRTISGYIYADINGGSTNSYDVGEAIPNGFVRAETTDGTKRAHAPVDGTGHFTLGLVNGTWKVYGMADGYLETQGSADVEVSNSAPSPTANIELSADSNWSNTSKMTSITPSTGGILDDSAASSTGIRLTFPPNSLGTSNSTGSVNANRTASVAATNSSDPAVDAGINVGAQDNNGQAINNLNDYIDVELTLYKAEVLQAIANNDLTYDKLKNTVLSYWDSTANDWVSLATSRVAYYKPNSADTDWTLYNNTATTTDQFEAFMNELATRSLTPADYKLVFSSKSNHLTIFAVIMPFVASPAEAAPVPETPSGGGGGGGGSITSNCTAVTYDAWGNCTSGWQYRNILTRTPNGCTLTADQESKRKQACKLASNATSTTESTTDQTTSTQTTGTVSGVYAEEAEMVYRAEVNEIMPAVGITVRNHVGESLSRVTLIDKLKIDLNSLPLKQQYALTNFITYGSQSTAWLGWGERAGVLNSYRSAFGRWPETAGDWQDVIKIGNGRWPNARSSAAETKALKIFKNIYKRDANRANRNDDAAVTVIAYGLRPNKRNFDSEKAAIKSFKAIYGYPPTGATDWDAVRAIAYSGAKR